MPALAQDKNGPSHYQLDVIVLRHLEPATGEQFIRRDGPAWNADALWLTPPNAGVLEPELWPNLEPPRRTAAFLPEEANQLASTWDQLRRSRAYRPIWQGSWKFAMKNGESDTFLIAPDEAIDDNRTLAGTFQVELGRYLHLTTDLAMIEWSVEVDENDQLGPEAQAMMDDAPFEPVVQTLTGAEPDEEAVAVPVPAWEPWGPANQKFLAQGLEAESIYRIENRHRTPSAVLNYQDHPHFGVLFQFTRLEMESSEPSE